MQYVYHWQDLSVSVHWQDLSVCMFMYICMYVCMYMCMCVVIFFFNTISENCKTLTLHELYLSVRHCTFNDLDLI